MVAVRTDDSKLITYPNHPEWTEMFQLDRDPYEIDNLAGKPEAKTMQDHLQTELDQLKDTLSYIVPGDSDKDTYVEDAERAMKAPKAPPAPAPSGETHVARVQLQAFRARVQTRLFRAQGGQRVVVQSRRAVVVGAKLRQKRRTYGTSIP